MSVLPEFIIFYLIITIPCLLGIYNLRTRNKEKWYKKSPSFYKFTEYLCWIITVLATFVFLTPEDQMQEILLGNDIVAYSLLILLLLCFLAAPILFIYVGVKSIRERKSVYKILKYGPIQHAKGLGAILWGLFYIGIGSIFLYGVLYVILGIIIPSLVIGKLYGETNIY